MNTLFNRGFQAPIFNGQAATVYALAGFGNSGRKTLGQVELVDKATRDKYLAKIALTRKKSAAVLAWFTRAIQADPTLARTLGGDATAFWGANARFGVGEPMSDGLWNTFQSNDPLDWSATPGDLTLVDDWADQIDIMYGIMAKVAPLAATVPGASMLKTGGTIFGLPTQDVLLGGAIAAGVGVLLYAIS